MTVARMFEPQNRYNVRILTLNSPADLAAELAAVAPHADAMPSLAEKTTHTIIRIERLNMAAAQTLRQELQALHAEAIIGTDDDSAAQTNALIVASLHQLHALTQRLATLPLSDLQALASELDTLLHAESGATRGVLTVAGRDFVWGTRTYVMGIINITPDSFSADGLAGPAIQTTEVALAQARRFAQEGADILDIGGESTRPGAHPVEPAEELRRVVPVIAAIAREIALPISIDTYRAEVARAALDAGAHLVNDIWGLRTPTGEWNAALAALVCERGVPIVLMHNRRAQAARSTIGGHYSTVEYHDLLGEVIAGLRERAAFAVSQGISPTRIIIDPGLGFGKTPAQNLVLLRRLGEFRSLGLPLLVGASRKSFIGLPLNLPAQERDEGTAATTALAIQSGADIVRVHNVRMNVRAARIADAIVRVPPSP